MKRFILLLGVAVMILPYQELQSQSLRDRVKKAIFSEPEEETSEEATQEEEDRTENSRFRLGNQAIMDAMGLSGNVDYEEVYHFNSYIQMELTSYKPNGNLDSKIIYDNYLHKEDADYAMVFRDKGDQSTIIFDAKNSAMLILGDSNGEKTGFATSVDPEAMAEEFEDYEEEDTEVEEVDMESYRPVKTGRTKVILGYTCDEYLVEDEGSEVHMWVSEKLGKEVRKEWMKNQQTFGAMFVHANAMNGMTLEYDLVDADGARSVMLVTAIELNHSHQVNTGGYNIMSMRMQGGEDTEEE